MDSNPNQYKGYGKINYHLDLELEDQTPNPKPSTKSIVLTISAIAVLTITIFFMLAALIHQSTTTESLDSQIKLVCNVTRYPDSCFSSISSLETPTNSAIDPVAIFKLSLRVSVDALSGMNSLLKSGADSGPGAKECESLFEDALGRLNESAAAVEGEALTERKIGDVQTWISAAATDLETCSDGLEEMGSTLGEEVNDRMKKAKQFTSNSLAIIANIRTIFQKFRMSIP